MHNMLYITTHNNTILYINKISTQRVGILL